MEVSDASGVLLFQITLGDVNFSHLIFCHRILQPPASVHSYAQLIRAATALAYMVDILFQIDGIYRLSQNFNSRIGVLIAGGKVAVIHLFKFCCSKALLTFSHTMLLNFQLSFPPKISPPRHCAFLWQCTSSAGLQEISPFRFRQHKPSRHLPRHLVIHRMPD